MNSLQIIQDFLGQKRLAVVGVSRQPKDFSLALFRELRKRGYEAVPVNPATEEIDEQPCFARLQAIHPPASAQPCTTVSVTAGDVINSAPSTGGWIAVNDITGGD